MQIKKSDLKIIIENYLNEAAPANKKEADAFRQWMQDNRKKDADRLNLDPPDENTQNNSYVEKAYRQFGEEYEADTEYFGLGKYIPSFGSDEEESVEKKKVEKKYTPSAKSTNGCVILCHWKGSKAVSKKMEKGMKRSIFEFCFPQGHAGVILIEPNRQAHYFDFGRYSPSCSNFSEEASKLRTAWDLKLRNSGDMPVMKQILNAIGHKGGYDAVAKESFANTANVRYQNLGKANVKEEDASLILDPIKSIKQFAGVNLITVDEAEVSRLREKLTLSLLKDGEFFVCPDVAYVSEAVAFGKKQLEKTCHLYSLIPLTGYYNCGTFATHLALIAGKGQGMIANAWLSIRKFYDPTTQPAIMIPNMADLMDYTFKVNVK